MNQRYLPIIDDIFDSFQDMFKWIELKISSNIAYPKLSQCMTKGGLWHDVILMRKEHCDVIAVYFSICIKSKSFEQWKINIIEEWYNFLKF